MLHTSEFPFAGAQALLGGELVTIRQHIDAETALVFGKRINGRRVLIAQLQPPPERSLFDRWRDERLIEPRLGTVFTPVADIAADYLAWLGDNGAHADTYPVSEPAFLRMMREAGYASLRGYWRSPGDTHARVRRLYPLALAGVR